MHDGRMAQGRRILLVEDDEAVVEVIEQMLAYARHDVAVARNGREAVEIAPVHHPELIILDINLPVMDGYAAARAIREMPEFAETPIIALTGMASLNTARKCLAAGCTGYLAKPIGGEELFKMLGEYLPAG